jgi:hypothetical protein
MFQLKSRAFSWIERSLMLAGAHHNGGIGKYSELLGISNGGG